MALSQDPEKRARSLANLKKGNAKSGNSRAMTHGLGADASKLPATAKAAARADIEAELAASAPVRAADGGLPVADRAIVELAASALARHRHVEAWLDAQGYFTPKGNLRPVVVQLGKIDRALTELLDRLGMTPRSRAALGVDLARTVDVAEALSEKDPAKREALLREAGVIEGSAEEVG